MKISINFTALIICIVHTSSMYAQFGISEFRPALVENIDFTSTGNIDVTSETYFSSLNRTISISKVDGSPYINDNFMPVKISSFENMVFSGRFNANSGQMEIITSPGKAPIALNINTNSYIVEFIEDKKVYQTYNFKDSNGLIGKSFFVKVTTNKISLLKKEFVNFVDEKIAVDYYKKDKPAKFVRQNDVYYLVDDSSGIATQLPSNKKDIAKMFSNNYDSILEYMNSNKIKLNKEEDLIKLSNYISSLN